MTCNLPGAKQRWAVSLIPHKVKNCFSPFFQNNFATQTPPFEICLHTFAQICKVKKMFKTGSILCMVELRSTKMSRMCIHIL
jgi:hypothetical protein